MRALLLLAIAGCSSIVDGPCADGYELRGGACVVAAGSPDAGTGSDGGVPVIGDATIGDASTIASPDALTCTFPEVLCHGTCIDVSSDPMNCGACGHVCASGICIAGHCEGELAGHVIAIGHDYRRHNAAMARVLGNAVALASASDIGVVRMAGTAAADARAGTSVALAQAMGNIGRSWHAVALAGDFADVDVAIVDAQSGDGDDAQARGAVWADAFAGLLARGGTVIVLEGSDGVSFRYAAGAGLFVTGAPMDVTEQAAFVMDASDAVVQQVVSPYLADSTSVVYPGLAGAIGTPQGAVVVHWTRGQGPNR